MRSWQERPVVRYGIALVGLSLCVALGRLLPDSGSRAALTGGVTYGLLLCVSLLALTSARRAGQTSFASALLVVEIGVIVFVVPALPAGNAAVTVDSTQITPAGGHAYRISLRDFGVWGRSDHEGKSSLVLRENGVELAGPHARHATIRDVGKGSYSHWNDWVYFSSSDNSDPRSNGRVYSLTIQRKVRDRLPHAVGRSAVARLGTPVAGMLLMLSPLLLLVWRVGTSSVNRLVMRAPDAFGIWWLNVGRPLAAAWCLLACLAGLLWMNVLNVTLLPVVLVHLLLAVALTLAGLFIVFLGWRGHRRFVRRTGAAYWVIASLNLILAVIPASVAQLMAAESAARAWPAETSSPLDPGVKFFWPECFEPRNSLGHCDREHGKKTGPRVMILGDSYVEGAGVRRSQRFSHVLEETLRARGVPVEVLNAGRCGFDTMDEAEALERTGDAFRPDVVVVAYTLNDAEGPDPASKKPLDWLDALLIVRLRSYLFYRVFMMVHRFSYSSQDALETPVTQHAQTSPGWRRVKEALARISEWCDRRGVRKFLVVYPIFGAGADQYRTVMDRVVAEGERDGFVARSALGDFQGRWQDFMFSYYDGHPDPRAHRIMGVRLAETIGEVEVRYHPPGELMDAQDRSENPR